LDVAPQGKQLIELPELPQPESAGQLWLTVRVVQYLFRHSDNELLHWMVALDGKPLASGEVPLDVAPQGKQLIELPELPQPESAGQLWLTVRVVQ
ncbi:beta-galactosidase domain 4-containing protein, partial [Staphylococcus aureus]|uniref:beta-galactosidase domain 4-containing protein n=1 Tax=Staphylococcus aureus TaxID=1280 RepID=UPI002181E561